MSFFKINNISTFLKVPSFLATPTFVNFGCVEDDPTLYYKDYKFSDSPMATTPITSQEISLKQYFKEVSNQYSIGSCVANAVCDSLEAMTALRKGVSPAEIPDFSRLFTYYNARNLANPPTTNVDKGSQIRFAFHSVKTHGVCKESTWKYEGANVLKQPSWLSYKEAVQNRISAFYRINTNDEDEKFEQILRALNNKNPVVFGTLLCNSFRKVNSDAVVQEPKDISSDFIIGRHAMILVGWSASKQAFIIRNSWGSSWGVEGYCYMSKNYITGYAGDIWVPTV